MGGYDMLIILPDKMDAVKNLEDVFLKKSKNYAYLLSNMTVHNVELDVPKFKFESDLNLEKTMQKVSEKNIVVLHTFTDDLIGKHKYFVPTSAEPPWQYCQRPLSFTSFFLLFDAHARDIVFSSPLNEQENQIIL